MANIKLTNYSYREYKVGEIVDLGEEKNASLVSFQRAVWVGEDKKESKKIIKEVVEEIPQEQVQETEGELETEVDIKDPEPEKKFLQNELKVAVEEKKKNSSKKSFWDKLK